MTADQEQAAFMEALLAGDDSACGPFADWLEEHGEVDAAAALRQPGGAHIRQEDRGLVLWWWGEEPPRICRVGPVNCPCGRPARFCRHDGGRRQYLCPACNEEARRRRGVKGGVRS